ncbi:MAG: hypothetical protein ACRDL5_02850 [Solirubrobacteraceae bacterium]
MTAKQLSGNEVRVPDPVQGEAAVISRYGKERAIVIHPSDFHRLTELEQMLSAAAALDPIELSYEAIRAHRDEDSPGVPVTDPAALADLFG